MRIPFVPRDIRLHKERFEFIQQYRGGGFMLIAGAIYWLLAFALTYLISGEMLLNFYIWGGLLVPMFGLLFFKLLRLKTSKNQYTSLVAFSSAFTVCCFPILLLIKDLEPSMILPAICIINATHLLILCWVHLEYLYAILLMLGECMGMTFMYSIPNEYVHFICLIWGIVSLVFGLYINQAAKTPLKGYNYKIIDTAE